jgi:hypothetical protein
VVGVRSQLLEFDRVLRITVSLIAFNFISFNSQNISVYGGASGESGSTIDIQLGSGSASSTTTNTGGVQMCESALAQRRSAYLPKLRQLSSNVTNLSFEQNVSEWSFKCLLEGFRPI